MQLTAQGLGCSSLAGTALRQAPTAARGACRAPLSVTAGRDVQGRVVGVQSQKTAVVQVDRYVPHRLYGKRVRVSKKFHVHDEEEQCSIGDTVSIVPTRPISKTKSYKVERIVTRSDL